MSQQKWGWSDALAGSLVRHAAHMTPSSLAARLEEEWLADLDERPSGSSRLRFALGCWWATRIISREHRPLSVPVASATRTAALIGYQHPAGLFSRRTGILFLVVGLHAGVFYGVMTGSIKLPTLVPQPLQVHNVEAPRPKVLPPPPPKEFPKTTIEVPPWIPLDPWKDPDGLAVVVKDPQPPPVIPSQQLPPHEVQHVSGGPAAGFPDPDDYYPSAARRLEEQGVTTVRVCVDPNGKLTSAPTDVLSSGNPRLDEAALKLASAGSGHYRASTEDGRPVTSCYPFRVRFQIKK